MFWNPPTRRKLTDFQDEQIGQLQELMQEATKLNRQFNITESRNQSSSLYNKV